MKFDYLAKMQHCNLAEQWLEMEKVHDVMVESLSV